MATRATKDERTATDKLLTIIFGTASKRGHQVNAENVWEYVDGLTTERYPSAVEWSRLADAPGREVPMVRYLRAALKRELADRSHLLSRRAS